MFEHRNQPLLPWPQFLRRLAQSGGIALGLIVLSLFIGMIGYHGLEHLSWIDAFLNSAMLLGGMGPVNSPVSSPGKIFAGVYALYCGLLVIFVAGVLFAPLLHRLLHKFHLQKDSN
jgi:hypothetical protein